MVKGKIPSPNQAELSDDQFAIEQLRAYATRSASDSDMSQLAAYLAAWLSIKPEGCCDRDRVRKGMPLADTLQEATACLMGYGQSTNSTPRIRLANRQARMFFSDPRDWSEETALLNLLTIATVIGPEKSFLSRQLAKQLQDLLKIG